LDNSRPRVHNARHHFSLTIMKFLFDIFPVLLFFLAFKIWGIYTATAVAIAATFVQVGWSWARHRKVDNMLWASLAIIVVFGGATLWLHDDTFIKWKPTVLYWLFGSILLGSEVFFRKNLIRAMMDKQITLPGPVWQKLNLSWIAFFALMGAANLYIAFPFAESFCANEVSAKAACENDVWVNFKVFGGIGLMLIFILVQGLMLSRYIESEERN
jgi:intracellular septation protein